MSSSVWSSEGRRRVLSLPFVFALLIVVIALGVGGATSLLDPILVSGGLFLLTIIVLRQDELIATAAILISLYYDWYWAYRVIALVLVVLLLLLFFLQRSSERPWVEPRALWLWALFLILALFPAIRGALSLHDVAVYYPSVVFGALILFWLGTAIGRNPASIHRLFNLLAILSVLVAVHTIIQATTGVTLLESPQVNSYLASVSNYQLSVTTNIYRLGSFFIQPNFCGTFFAMVIFIPLGLFVESVSLWKKMLYLGEMLIMLPALIFTYSASAWLSALIGLLTFALLVGRTRYRVQIPLLIALAAVVLWFWFPAEVRLLIRHATDPNELQLRGAVWTTALRVIQAYPLTGVGLGHLAYQQGAEPYRVPEQPVPFDHPHNSYLEWAAMAGIPVLILFLAVLGFALWRAWRLWLRADKRTRSLLAVGIVVAVVLSVNSWSNQGWTMPPLAALGWMILGCVSSPLLERTLLKAAKEQTA